MDGARELIGRGRACDVFAAGPGRVLRRYRTPHPGFTAHEFIVMAHLRRHGYPVPAVHEYDEFDLVMERVEGVTMLQRLASAPWQLGSLASMLADLHRRLGEIAVDGLDLPAPFGAPSSVLHLDLHPENVMLSPTGPVVIDWSNACLGPRSADVAYTWLIMDTSEVDVPAWIRPFARHLRHRFVDRFVDLTGRDAARRLLATMGERRLADPNVRPTEATRVRALVAAQALGS